MISKCISGVLVVAIDLTLAPLLGVQLQRLGLALRRVLGIHIAHRHAIGKVHRLRTHRVPAIARANAAQNRPVVLALRLRILRD